MPWEQFTGTGDLKTSFTNLFRNNSNTVINASYFYDTIPGFLKNYAGGAYNEATYYSSGYCGNAPQVNPPFDYVPTLPTLTGPTSYNFTEYLYTGASDFDSWNDTLHYSQVFDNYFAYDDGSPECAWFVSGVPTIPTYVAQEFTLNKPDTLVAVQMYFDYTLVNAKVYPFHLAVWNDKGGVPGTMIFEDTANLRVSTPAYDSASLNLFTQYILDSAHGIILPAGKFYIGWVQVAESAGSDSINIGMDLNNNNADKIFICTNPLTLNWQNTIFPGSLMMRPVFGPKGYAAIAEINSPVNNIALYPNPTTGEVTIQSSVDFHHLSVKVFNTLGEVVYDESHISLLNSQFSIDLSSLPTGFYIVQLNSGSHSTFKKLIIQR